MIEDCLLNEETLLITLDELAKNRNEINHKIQALNIKSATEQIVTIIEAQILEKNNKK